MIVFGRSIYDRLILIEMGVGAVMKKGNEYIGVVGKIKFPNKGIVEVYSDDGQQEKCIVKNVLPGQKIRFRVTKKKSGLCEGACLEVIEKSPCEIESSCPHFSVCGGCSYQNLPYDKQLELKETQVHELLEPVLRSGFDVIKSRSGVSDEEVDITSLFESIVPSPVKFEYRNKMEFSFGDGYKDGELELGLHKSRSFYDIVTVKNCQIIDDDYKEILTETLSYFRGKETPYYHKRTHEGFLRFLLVRKAKKTGEILVDIVTTSDMPKDTVCTEVSLLEDYKDALLSLKLSGKIEGILHTIDDGVADAVANDYTEVLYGRDYIYEEVLGLKFKITAFSFFQTNTLSAEVLYGKVREYVRLFAENNGETGLHKVLFDLYSGTGTITQLMSPVAQKVIGVEIVEEAVEAAKENAKLNGLENCDFLAGDVLKVLDEIEDKPDFIILDPPRDGINPKALKKIIDYGVKNIVYVSCKPSSLARDLAEFMASGYEPVRICPIDQFPGTVHVETVVLLSKKHVNYKEYIEIGVDDEEYYKIKGDKH